MKDKPNNENSTVKQVLLDLKASGGDAEAIDLLISQIEQDHTLRENSDKLFQSHQYPEHSLNWFKLQGDIEFPRFLSPNATAILIDITHLTSLKAVQPALKELVQNGCITEVIEASGRRSAVYMINPEIATVGKKKPHLTYIFWKKVKNSLLQHEDADDEDEKNIDWNDYPKSPIRDRWVSLTKDRTYSKGTESWKEGAHSIRYNKIRKLEAKGESVAKTSLDHVSKESCTESHSRESRIIQFTKTTASKKKLKAAPDTCLEEDELSWLPF